MVMPKANSNRAKGKHKGGRKQYTDNKFLITSAEAHLLETQVGMLQQHIMMLYSSLHERISKLEPIEPTSALPATPTPTPVEGEVLPNGV